MKFGTNDISKIYLGTNGITKSYFGTNSIYEEGGSGGIDEDTIVMLHPCCNRGQSKF